MTSTFNTRKHAVKLALFGGVLAIAALASMQRANADSALCANGSECGQDLPSPSSDQHFFRFSTAHDQVSHHDNSLRRTELSAKDYPSYSGVGVIACTVNGKQRTSTAFLVGAFDIGVTVAHTFEKGSNGAEPSECVYNSLDSLGQIRERIPVSYVKSQWDEAGSSGQAANDFAVVRLSEPSRYAQRTMPLGRFSGDSASVVMIGYKSDIDSDSIKRKARGTVYERRENGLVISNAGGFTHDMDSRDIAAGAPVIDETTGVIIGIHTQPDPSRNTMITMNDWLEATIRTEMQARQENRSAEARAN
ncbi:MAG: trypsin-like peptidase domain-containing protein [Steroidobacter sp.]